jgi:hypothetical protein
VLHLLGHKDVRQTKAGPERLFEKMGALDPLQVSPIPSGAMQRMPKFLQPGVLLTLYNANRHLEKTAIH